MVNNSWHRRPCKMRVYVSAGAISIRALGVCSLKLSVGQYKGCLLLKFREGVQKILDAPDLVGTEVLGIKPGRMYWV